MTAESDGAGGVCSVCSVCNEALTENQASCYECGAAFHLALRIDVGAKDCGDAWIDDEAQALVFGCNRCLGRQAPESPSRRRYARREGDGARGVARARRSQRGVGRGGA